MQLNNGQEEPIFPRLETLSQNLGQAEQTLGEPSNQFNASSITTAITGRPPMNRGGVASLVDREKYGLGSKLKSFVRKVIPNEVAQVASVAAPFVAPFNPILAGAMAGLGSFDKTGRIGSSLLRGGLTYAGGQAARYLGGAGFQQGFNPFAGADFSGGITSGLGSLFTSPIGTQTGLQLGQYFQSPTDVLKGTSLEFKSPLDLSNVAGDTLKGTSLGMDVKAAPGTLDQLKTIFSPSSSIDLSTRVNTAINLTGDAIKNIYTDPRTGKVDFRAVISTISLVPSYLDAKKKAQEAGIPPDQFNEQVFNQEKEFFRQKYAAATSDSAFGLTAPTGRLAQAAEGGLMDDTGGILSIKLTPAMAMGGRIDYETGGPTTTTPVKTLPMDLDSLARRLFNTNLDNLSPSEKQYLYEFKEQNKNKKAKGGIMGSEIPLRQNEGGITELDLRAKGGYIPVGIKEKADDVPAMLSKNEFVFTADAVRGAGDGNINKGAQKMYKLMKSLEKKVKKIKKVA